LGVLKIKKGNGQNNNNRAMPSQFCSSGKYLKQLECTIGHTKGEVNPSLCTQPTATKPHPLSRDFALSAARRCGKCKKLKGFPQRGYVIVQREFSEDSCWNFTPRGQRQVSYAPL
jgi:hypothetical protein